MLLSKKRKITNSPETDLMLFIKNDMLLGLNTQKTYMFKFSDESGGKLFKNMIASGDFSYEVVPGDTIIFKILFVYKRK